MADQGRDKLESPDELASPVATCACGTDYADDLRSCPACGLPISVEEPCPCGGRYLMVDHESEVPVRRCNHCSEFTGDPLGLGRAFRYRDRDLPVLRWLRAEHQRLGTAAVATGDADPTLTIALVIAAAENLTEAPVGSLRQLIEDGVLYLERTLIDGETWTAIRWEAL